MKHATNAYLMATSTLIPCSLCLSYDPENYKYVYYKLCLCTTEAKENMHNYEKCYKVRFILE